MRLFFALWPDVAVQRALAGWARSCHATCGGRCPGPDKLHVTLAFLGEIETERYRTLLEIADSVRGPGFELTLDRIDYWRRNRIVCAGASRVPERLAELARCLVTRLGMAGLRLDARDFVPHVTLLRDAKRTPDWPEMAPLTWTVSTMSLVETLRANGKIAYRQLQRWTLSE
jgi:2'-5' RNA ligase